MQRKAYYADYIYYEGKVHTDSYLLVTGDKIQGISSHADEEGGTGYDIEHFHNSFIMPGLINTHTHLPMGLFRGMADDLALMDWLQNHIWPAESKWLSEDFVLAATQLAAAEMIKSGTTACCDMYFLSDTIASAVHQAGLKALIGVGVLDFATKFGKNADEYLDNAAQFYLKYENDSLIQLALCPHAPYTVGPENFRKCVDFCKKHDVLLHTHIAEAPHENAQSIEKYGMTHAELMNDVGALDIRNNFAHCVHLTDKDIELMGKKSANVSHCIQSNMKLASGFAPVKKMIDAGINLSIGTDGAASNNDLDMIQEMSSVALVHKALNMDATLLSAETVIKMATINGAKALGLKKTGELKRGNMADFIVVSFDEPHMTPVFNPLSHMVYSANSSDVTATYVNGKCLMKDRQLQTLDEKKIKEDARRWAQKIKDSK